MRFVLKGFLKTKVYIKKILPHSLFGRSLLILVTPIFLIQIITTFIFFDRHFQKMSDRLAFSIANEVALISNMIELDDSPENIAKIKANLEETLDVRIVYKKGVTLHQVFEANPNSFQSPDRESLITQTLANVFDHRLMRPFDIHVEKEEKWFDVKVRLRDGVVKITFPERRIFSSSGYIVLIWMVGSSIILIVIATLFMRNQIKPIHKLALAAERFGKGRDVPFFKVEGAKEVRQAARAFIDMKDRLARQMQQRTIMLAGVSHDLRTPLTRMKLQLEMMDQNDSVMDLKKDLSDMTMMLEAYLQFARGEGGEAPIRTNIKELIHRVATPFNREKTNVYGDDVEDVALLLRPVAFERCMANLIGNALKYGTKAWISAKKIGDNLEICLDDNGTGIPPEQYDDVFKPFFRGESSRNSKTGGVGLGLPIVQDIVNAHGGQVRLDKSPKGGLRVIVDMPL